MARTSQQPKPSTSGAVMFYGAARKRAQKKVKIAVSRNLKASAHQQKPTSTTSSSLKSDLALTSFSLSSLSSPTTVNSLAEATAVLSIEKHAESVAESALAITSRYVAVVGLLRDVSEIFQTVPYIKVVAGLVQMIIDISDQVHTNKEKTQELVEKAMSYSRVVFAALLECRHMPSKILEDLKEDLLAMGSVLESILSILKRLSNKTATSRFSRTVHRQEILAKIGELDRKLDTAVMTFQLKSSIALRMNRNSLQPEQPLSMPPLAIPSFRSYLRPKPRIMFGRTREIELIVNHVLTQNARLAILGPGGIGKTALALSVLHDQRVRQKYDTERLFVSCEALSSVDLLISELAYVLGITMENTTNGLFNGVLGQLRQKPSILTLDNFETLWDPLRTRPNVEQFLEEINSIDSLSLIITMRGSQHPAGVSWSNLLPTLKPIDLDSAKQIFSSISNKLDMHAVRLVQAVDCVPLAVTLLANLAAVDGETTAALWHRWTTEATAMVERGDDRLSSLEASVELSISGPRMTRDPHALPFLSIISLLPDGMSTEAIQACEKGLPSILNVKRAVSTLRQNALVSDDQHNSLRVLSPIRHFIRRRYPLSPEAREFIQGYFIGLALQGATAKDKSVRDQLNTEVGNIEAILIDSLHSTWPLEQVVDAILTFSHYTYTTGTGSPRAISLAVERLEKLDSTPDHVLSITSDRVTNRYSALRRSRFFQRPREKERGEDSVQTVNLKPLALKLRGDCLGCWGQLLCRQLEFKPAAEKFDLAMRMHQRAGDVAGHAYDLHNLGCLLSKDLSDRVHAEASFNQAAKLHAEVGDEVGQAYDLIGIGQLLLHQSKYQDAHNIFSQAYDFFVAATDEEGQAVALNKLGSSLQACSQFAASQEYFERSLTLNVSIGDVIGQAESLAGLACTTLLQCRFRAARTYIEEAITLRHPFVDLDHLHIFGRVLAAALKFDDAKITLERALKLQTEDNNDLGRADNLHYLAYIMFNIPNQFNEAYAMIETANELYRRQKHLMGEANTCALQGAMRIRFSDFKAAQEQLECALHLHTRIGCLLGQAFDLHHLGCLFLRTANFETSTLMLRRALELHTRVGNVQGQTDDLNKLCEVQVRQGLLQDALIGISNALATHIQLEDVAGQGDDLYIQASIRLEQSEFEDAKNLVRAAMACHKEARIGYSLGRDSAVLGYSLWGRYKQLQKSRLRLDALQAIEQAIEHFETCGASNGEAKLCHQQYTAMKTQ